MADVTPDLLELEAVPSGLMASLEFSVIENLATQSKKLEAYKNWFEGMNHTADWDNSVRLIYEMVQLQRNGPDPVSEEAGKFLEGKVHPDFLKLLAGEEFYLESVEVKGAYMFTEDGDWSHNIMQLRSAIMHISAEEIADKDEWKYQLLPAFGEDGLVFYFYMRSKLYQSTSVPPYRSENWEFLKVRPMSPIITKDTGASFTSNIQIALALRGVDYPLLPSRPDHFQELITASPGDIVEFCLMQGATCLRKHWKVHFSLPQVTEASGRFARIAAISEAEKQLEEYTRWFKEMNHTSQWKDSNRLISRIMELRRYYGGSVASDATKFLEDNLHPDYLRLLDGEPFNLENVKHKGHFLYMGRVKTLLRRHWYEHRDPDLYWESALSTASEFEISSQDKWKYQLVQVPGKDGQLFYLRNRLKAHKPIPEIHPKMESWNNNFVMIRPISSILRSADGVQDSDLRILFRETLSSASHACEDVAWGPTQNDDGKADVSGLPGMQLKPWQDVSTDEGTQWTPRFIPLKGPGSAQNFYPVDQLESPSERLEEYKRWFRDMNHTAFWWNSVCLVHKIMEVYNSSDSSVSTDAKKFLSENVHPDLLRLLAGDVFLIENVKHRGYYLRTGVAEDEYCMEVLCDETVLELADRATSFEGDNWNYQLLPVPQEDEMFFYVRTRLQKNRPVPKFNPDNGDFVQLHPVSPITQNENYQGDKELQVSFFMPDDCNQSCDRYAYGPQEYNRTQSSSSPMNLSHFVEVGPGTRWIPRFLN